MGNRRKLLSGVCIVWIFAMILLTAFHKTSFEQELHDIPPATSGGNIINRDHRPPPTTGSITHKHTTRALSTRGSATCSGQSTCLACLFRSAETHRSGCVWCASTRRCVDASSEAANHCEDVEDTSCPSILHSKVPQAFRVLYVGIRKGGPEALVQLHLGLHHWGFTTTLETRKVKKEKGGPILPFFLEKYKQEFVGSQKERWFNSYNDWHSKADEGDIMIATETWACQNDPEAFLPKGARQMQWHLTVWARKDRSGCSIVGHTRYIASGYMRQSKLALVFPYVSPHIVELAKTKNWRKQKENLVLFDHDSKLKESDLRSPRTKHKSILAAGFKPDELYALYGKAKAGIDLALPGGERFIYEAVLFDVCVVVDKSLNGLDLEDFPIPEKFRVAPNNLTALNIAKDECINNYENVVDEFEPLREHGRKQRATFLRHIRRYYSNSVHIVTALCSEEQGTKYLIDFIMTTLLMVPFASIEIAMPREVKERLIISKSSPIRRQLGILKENSYLAAVQFVEMSRDGGMCKGPQGSNDVPHAASAHFTNIWSKPTRTLYTMWLNINAVIVNSELVYELGSALALREEGTEAITTHQAMLLFATSNAVNVVQKKVLNVAPVGNNRDVWAARGGGVIALDETPFGGSTYAAELRSETQDDGATVSAAKAFWCQHELWKSLGSQKC